MHSAAFCGDSDLNVRGTIILQVLSEPSSDIFKTRTVDFEILFSHEAVTKRYQIEKLNQQYNYYDTRTRVMTKSSYCAHTRRTS